MPTSTTASGHRHPAGPDDVRQRPAPPSATYRLQLHPGFTFFDAAALTPYLAELGVSHVYSSPILEAVQGSAHGYDVTDPTRLREELGGDAGFNTWTAALAHHGLALVVDIVPNHMAVKENAWLGDVLERGARSPYFHVFDFGTSLDADAERRFVLPVLGEPYGVELDASRLRLYVESGRVWLAYGEDRFPIAVTTLQSVIDEAAAHPGADVLSGLARRLGTGRRASPGTVARKRTVALEAALAQALADPPLAAAIAEAVRALNDDTRRLHELLERQHYRLAWWRLARDEQAYRRFFDINGLIGVRMELPDVFERTHARIGQLLDNGRIQGLRVDHVDGLADPATYLTRLAERAPGVWIVVEKILAIGETLPPWPVAGTTGYEASALITMLFMPAEHEEALTTFYETFSGVTDDFDQVAEDAVVEVASHWLAADVNGVADVLHHQCVLDLRLRDYSVRDCVAVVREMLAALPVYRTYTASGEPSEADARLVSTLLDRVRQRRPDVPAPLVDFVAAGFAMRATGVTGPLDEFVMRFEQLCPAIRAKAIEDTACFRYNRQLALNDVGADPGRFSVTTDDFHAAMAGWQAAGTSGLRTTSSHDSKRSEDVRARLTAVAEAPSRWFDAVQRWHRRAAAWTIDGFPDPNFEYYFFQTLVGAWPLSLDRALVHAEKAIRESKAFTNWLTPSPPYEAAVRRFVESCFGDRPLMEDVAAFVDALHPADWHKALSQLLLKLTMPGVPDLYQGSELWLLTLSDPDNRTAVDYGLRQALLAASRDLPVEAITARAAEGLPKLWTLARTLQLRRRQEEAFSSAYTALPATGPRADALIGFLRGTTVAVVAPTRTMQVDWHGTATVLPHGCWRHVFTDDEVDGGPASASDLFARFPVALLERTT